MSFTGNNAPSPGVETGEITNLYDRNLVDTAILRSQDAIGAIAAGVQPDWTSDQYEAARKMLELVKMRYEELTRNNPQNRPAYELLGPVFEAWTENYFFPRTERVGVATFDDWVTAFVQNGNTDSIRLTYTREQPRQYTFYRAIAPLELVPFSDANTVLIIPPDTEVTGNPGSMRVYRWDDLLNSPPLYPERPETAFEESITIFDSTQALLDGLSSAPHIEPIDVELALRTLGQQAVQ